MEHTQRLVRMRTHMQYSGVGKGKPLPMVLAIKCGAIDRGASIAEYSQYPGEVRARTHTK